MIVDRTVKIVNPEGMHARPSGAVVAVAMTFESQLRIRCGDLDVNGRSILELITLGATCGSELQLRAEGPDADRMVEAVAALVDSGFSDPN